MRLLRRDDDSKTKNLFDDEKMKAYIARTCKQEIDTFLGPCFRHIRMSTRAGHNLEGTIERKNQNAEKQVIFFLFKTLTNFCRSKMSREDFQNPRTFGRSYYPGRHCLYGMVHGRVSQNCLNSRFPVLVQLYHKNRKNEAFGFSLRDYNNRVAIAFYADLVSTKLWDKLMKEEIISYDLEVKRAHLQEFQIGGSLLLVDESQDMDECQIRWMAKQSEFGTHVYLVGDCVQAIYSFRGAKPKCLMELSEHYPIQDCDLTVSWRFGHDIARIANVILFCKEKSPQTTTNRPAWRPYRVKGGSKTPCKVTGESLLENWKERKVTVIAFANVTLMMEAVRLLGFTMHQEESDGSEDEAIKLFTGEEESENHESEQDDTVPLDIPKIHLNGKGENSGAGKWKGVFKKIGHLYKLFEARPGAMQLPAQDFPEFESQDIDWTSFVQLCESMELSKYYTIISVVQKFREKTMEAIELFKEQVLNNKYSANDADIILSTCHAAKGMEWDNVHVCTDFVDLCKVHDKGPKVDYFPPDMPSSIVAGSPQSPKIPELPQSPLVRRIVQQMRMKNRPSWQIDCLNYGDDINLLYVVCTRAKRLLSIPKSFTHLLQDLDVLHLWIQARKRKGELQAGLTMEPKYAGLIVLGLKKPLPPDDAANLYQDLVQPLRAENSLKESELIVDTMLPDDTDPSEITETCVKMEGELETHTKGEGVNSRKRKSTGSTDTFSSRVKKGDSSAPIEMAPAFNNGNLPRVVTQSPESSQLEDPLD
jgi:hypothetical protein